MQSLLLLRGRSQCAGKPNAHLLPTLALWLEKIIKSETLEISLFYSGCSVARRRSNETLFSKARSAAFAAPCGSFGGRCRSYRSQGRPAHPDLDRCFYE